MKKPKIVILISSFLISGSCTKSLPNTSSSSDVADISNGTDSSLNDSTSGALPAATHEGHLLSVTLTYDAIISRSDILPQPVPIPFPDGTSVNENLRMISRNDIISRSDSLNEIAGVNLLSTFKSKKQTSNATATIVTDEFKRDGKLYALVRINDDTSEFLNLGYPTLSFAFSAINASGDAFTNLGSSGDSGISFELNLPENNYLLSISSHSSNSSEEIAVLKKNSSYPGKLFLIGNITPAQTVAKISSDNDIPRIKEIPKASESNNSLVSPTVTLESDFLIPTKSFDELNLTDENEDNIPDNIADTVTVYSVSRNLIATFSTLTENGKLWTQRSSVFKDSDFGTMLEVIVEIGNSPISLNKEIAYMRSGIVIDGEPWQGDFYDNPLRKEIFLLHNVDLKIYPNKENIVIAWAQSCFTGEFEDESNHANEYFNHQLFISVGKLIDSKWEFSIPQSKDDAIATKKILENGGELGVDYAIGDHEIIILDRVNSRVLKKSHDSTNWSEIVNSDVSDALESGTNFLEYDGNGDLHGLFTHPDKLDFSGILTVSNDMWNWSKITANNPVRVFDNNELFALGGMNDGVYDGTPYKLEINTNGDAIAIGFEDLFEGHLQFDLSYLYNATSKNVSLPIAFLRTDGEWSPSAQPLHDFMNSSIYDLDWSSFEIEHLELKTNGDAFVAWELIKEGSTELYISEYSVSDGWTLPSLSDQIESFTFTGNEYKQGTMSVSSYVDDNYEIWVIHGCDINGLTEDGNLNYGECRLNHLEKIDGVWKDLELIELSDTPLFNLDVSGTNDGAHIRITYNGYILEKENGEWQTPYLFE